MGDRTYVRFSIPLAAVSTIQRRRILAPALGLTVDDIEPAVTQDPSQNTSLAGYDNGVALRLVEGVPCLVMEDDQCNYGGSLIEDDLQEAGIPFLRFHLSGGSYGPGRAAFTGSGELHWVDCDSDGNPLIRVDVSDGKATVDPNALVLINDLLAAERAVLHSA